MVFKANYCLMQVKSIAECSKGSILHATLLTFIKLPFVINTFVLSIFEWPFYTGLTVLAQGQVRYLSIKSFSCPKEQIMHQELS